MRLGTYSRFIFPSKSSCWFVGVDDERSERMRLRWTSFCCMSWSTWLSVREKLVIELVWLFSLAIALCVDALVGFVWFEDEMVDVSSLLILALLVEDASLVEPPPPPARFLSWFDWLATRDAEDEEDDCWCLVSDIGLAVLLLLMIETTELGSEEELKAEMNKNYFWLFSEKRQKKTFEFSWFANFWLLFDSIDGNKFLAAFFKRRVIIWPKINVKQTTAIKETKRKQKTI